MTKAETLRALHHGPEVLVLPNAWDCASARIFEELGFPAIATTSAGVAFAQGYPDGQYIPPGEMLAVVRRISQSVDVPVTADLEGGYDDIGETAAVRKTGEVVINARTDLYLMGIGEESTRFERACERLKAYRDAGADCLFIPGVTA